MSASQPFDVVMILKSPVVNDSRVQKEARSLAKRGYRICVVSDSAGLGERNYREDGVLHICLDLLSNTHKRSKQSPAEIQACQELNEDRRKDQARIRKVVRTVANRLNLLSLGLIRVLSFEWQTSRLIQNLCDTIVELNPSVIHAHDLATLPASIRLAGQVGAQVLYDAHEFETGRHNQMFLDRFWARRTEQKCLPKVASVITVSSGIAQQLSSLYGIDVPIVILNSPDVSRCRTGAGSIREAINLVSGEPFFVYVGKIGPHRGIKRCLAALVATPDLHFACVGPADLEYTSKLNKFARSIGVESRFHILSPVGGDYLIDFIRNADFAVVPTEDRGFSYRYSLPNKLFEATFAGLPVCVSDLPEQRSFVEVAGNGIVVDVTDGEELAVALNDLASNYNRYKLGEAELDSLSLKFGWSAQEKALCKIYDRLIPRR